LLESRISRWATTLSTWLRSARTGAFRLASPLDWAARRPTEKRRLPPLWLRRHAGAVSKFESSAHEMAALLDEIGVLSPEDDVLDVGCGAGAMASEFAARLDPRRRYVGFDVHEPSVLWCRRRFANDPRFTFEVARLASPYGDSSGPPATSGRFPMRDSEAGLVVAKSVFTHLLEPEARHYLSETRRVLGPGRSAVITAFLFDRGGPQSQAVRRVFPHGSSTGTVRWRRAQRPTAAVAYDRATFESFVEAAGLDVQWISFGYFPGSDRLTGQDTVILGH
jgi:ubiquinone/menaquinone biosynthesis C-methylase UbiE